ncbi:leucine-rich repeat-containing protein 7 [Nephila pilipes]|uniref:Leucine-rich repeat-containing protein 7 n=1 Tax=Nephila pilipes TaxID=299642 RepID=A0A8X6TSY5_NEPPI|nr:leucine-rich repeat-containing protein 7 [Nephila pilipes]
MIAGDSSNMTCVKPTSEASTLINSDATESKFSALPNHAIDLDCGKGDEKNPMNGDENPNIVEQSYSDSTVNNVSTKINMIKNNEKVNDVFSQDLNSYTVISPKPSKIVPQPNIVNSPNPNKDIKLGASLSDGQTSFRRPGCFQAVPMNIPSVHSAPRKVEPEAKDTKENYDLKKEGCFPNTSEHPTSIFNAHNSKTSIHIESENNQAHSISSPNPGYSTDTKKNSGYVGGIIKNINKSLNSQNKELELDQKSNSKKNLNQHIPDKPKNESIESEKPPVKPTTRPGYPIQILSNNDMQSGKTTDRPPDLPKKDRNAVTMRNIIPISENKVSSTPSQYVNQNFTPEVHKSYSDKVQKIPDRQKKTVDDSHTLSELSKSSNSQNKIILENNKNSKNIQYNSKEHVPNNPGKISQHKVDNKSYSSHSMSNQSESSKVSSDKRFQKVLPPIDTTFQLKPCNARKSPSNFDQPTEDKVNQSNEKQNDVSNKEVVAVSKPSLPAKTSTSNKSDLNEPPTIPPKRSSMGLNVGLSDLPPKTIKHENNTERNVSGRQLERTKSLNENEHVNDVNESNKISKLHVDIVQAKDVNNEKNEQLQKGNMPDLLSRIVTDEKNELIILEHPNKVLKSVKSEEDELSKDNFSFNKESEKDNAPDSPKSPKRQSWFFGSHKNSLVFPVILSRNPELGFSIEGGVGSPRNPGKPYDSGIYVAHVLDDGPANNLLKPGDKILQVDGKDFTQLDHNKAVALLQESGATVSLMVSRQ